MPLYKYQEDILKQVYQQYALGKRAVLIVAPCGAGKSVIISEIAKRATDKGNRVLFLIHTKELKAQIKKSFASWGVNMDLADIAMVGTLANKIKRNEELPYPTLIITDETHHALAKSYRRIYDAFPDATRLGFTATPVRLNGGGLGDVYDSLVKGPDVNWLIENEKLAPFDYYAPISIDLSLLKTDKTGEYTNESINEAFTSGAIYGNAVEQYQKLANGQKAICYCYSIEFSKQIAEQFNAAGIAAAHIDGGTNASERDSIIEKFRTGEILVLCNVNIVSEGFDVPDCTVSILLRPTQSLTLYTQQSMRCMRYKEGKRAIIIDHVGNYILHRFPNAKRAWSLDPKQEKEKPLSTLYTCENCFAVWEKKDGEFCPICGTQVVHEGRKEKEVYDLEMEKKDTNHVFVVDYRKPSDCKSYKELQELGANRGYKPGWAYYQAKLLGFIV